MIDRDPLALLIFDKLAAAEPVLSPDDVARFLNHVPMRKLKERDVLVPERMLPAIEPCEDCSCQASERYLERYPDRLAIVCRARDEVQFVEPADVLAPLLIREQALLVRFAEDNRWSSPEQHLEGLWSFTKPVHNGFEDVHVFWLGTSLPPPHAVVDVVTNSADPYRSLIFAACRLSEDAQRQVEHAGIGILQPQNLLMGGRLLQPFLIDHRRLFAFPAVPAEDGPVRLSESPFVFGDRQRLAKLAWLKRRGFGYSFYQTPFDAELVKQAAPPGYFGKLWDQAIEEISSEIANGTLRARGFDSLGSAEQMSPIAPALWRSLDIDWEKSAASFGTRQFASIELSPALPDLGEGESTRIRLIIIRSEQRALLHGCRIDLSPQATSLLVALAKGAIEQPGQFLTFDALERSVWGKRASGDLRQEITRLRSRMETAATAQGSARDLIENKPAQGYRLALSATEIEILESARSPTR